MKFLIKEAELDLLPERALYWEEQQLLILSDLHLGKAGHFRKHGIPIPQSIHHDDLNRISQLIYTHQPKRILFLGDLFHSDLNAEWWQFTDWIRFYHNIQFMLARGNHDILPEALISDAQIEIADRFEFGSLSFTHIREELDEFYNLSGHIHPGVRLSGGGKQGLTLPCFHFTSTYGLLPAFGNFTGLAKIDPKVSDKVFVVTGDRVMDVSPSRHLIK